MLNNETKDKTDQNQEDFLKIPYIMLKFIAIILLFLHFSQTNKHALNHIQPKVAITRILFVPL